MNNEEETEIGLVYMLQPCELLGTNRYKIGASGNSTVDRCQGGYKKGTRILFMIECVNPYVIEKRLKIEFNNKFELIAGNEYFKGDEIKLKKSFRKIVFDYIDNATDIEDTYEKFEAQREKKKFEKKKAKEQKIKKKEQEKELKVQEEKQEKEKIKQRNEERNKKNICNDDIFFEWFNKYYEKGNDSDIIKLKDFYEDFTEIEEYYNLSKESKRKLNKKKIIEYISTNIVLKKYYRNNEKKINGIKYRERLHNYKRISKNDDIYQ